VHAQVGNWLVVHGRALDDPVREGEVVEVPHADGSPPYLVHWLDDDRLSLVFPGSDAVVVPTAPHAQAAPGRSRSHGAHRR
jgi:hypothetical protein